MPGSHRQEEMGLGLQVQTAWKYLSTDPRNGPHPGTVFVPCCLVPSSGVAFNWQDFETTESNLPRGRGAGTQE